MRRPGSRKSDGGELGIRRPGVGNAADGRRGRCLQSVPVRGPVERALPARMGTPFRWLVGSSWVGNLGDGIALAAGPLLVAGQTQDPFLVALGALVQRLPWLLFGLQAGVLADRIDRRLLVVAVDLTRAGVLAVLTTAV